MAAKHPSDAPRRGPDPAYHARIRAWWVEQGNRAFSGQATPAIEAAYLEAHPDGPGPNCR
ncbi:hypothetical protein E1298_01345 [Actinomadura rubrisoli]|uniref:Uncharacterized protein n=1 Tax=Actinomadura rubrisoli TaxID=2530368 RepID=A0A4R5CFB6_9ACTN|nr:hypothetical protein E1298_01345 [Actinomadura rubrisoli]